MTDSPETRKYYEQLRDQIAMRVVAGMYTRFDNTFQPNDTVHNIISEIAIAQADSLIERLRR